MSFDLGELSISLNLNTGTFHRDLDNAEQRVAKFGGRRIYVQLDLEDKATQSLSDFQNHIVKTQRWLNQNPLTVRADHTELKGLNEHIEAKRTHVKEVQQWLDRNPLTVKEGRWQKAEGRGDTQQDNDSQDASSSNAEQNTNALIENTKNFANFAASPFESVARGVFEGIGQNLSKEFSKGFNRVLQDSLDFNLEDIGAGVGDITATSAKFVNDSLGLNIKGGGRRQRAEGSPKGLASASGQKADKDNKGMPLAPILQETSQVEKVAVKAQTALRRVDHAVTKVAKVADGVAGSLARVVPGGSAALGTAKTAAKVAAPFAVAAGVEAFVPGGGALIHGVQQVVGAAMTPIADAVSANILGQLLPVVNGTIGSLPFGMGAGAAEAVATGVTGAVGGAASLGATVLGTGIAGKGASDVVKTAKNKLLGNDKQELGQLNAASEQLKLQAAEVTSTAYQQAQAITQGFTQVATKFNQSGKKIAQVKKLIAAADRGKQLSPSQVKLIASTIEETRTSAQQIVNDFDAVNQVIDANVSKMAKGESGFGSKAARLKAKVSGAKNKAQSFLNFSERFVASPKTELDRQIYGAITVDAVRIGDDTTKGVTKGVDKNKGNVAKAGKDIGDTLKQSTKKSLDIKSPSGEYERIGIDINRGLAKGLTRSDPLAAYNEKIRSKVQQFRSQVTKDDSVPNRSLSGLIQYRVDKGLSQLYRGNPIEQDMRRKEITKLRSQKQKALELEELLAQRYQQLEPKNAIPFLNGSLMGETPKTAPVRNPKQYARRVAKASGADRKIELLAAELAEFGTERYFEALYRQGGKAFRRKVFKGMDPKEARAMAGEVPGFGLAAATMVNPAIGAVAAAAPLALPLMPLAVAGLGLNNILAPVVGQIKEALMTVEPLIKRLETASGSPQAGAKELDYIRNVSSDLQTPLKPALENYAKLSIAAQRTKLEGDGVKELFEGISASIKAMRLSSADADLVFTAYIQMLSKGKINMEELRQQLGEKFPPAMSIFSKAMGVSTAEFDALSQKGALISDEVLPKVAKVLKEEYGDAAKSAGSDYIGAMANMENATLELQKTVGDKYGGLFAGVTNLGAGATNAIATNFDTINKLIGAGLIGISAQIAVGLQAILASPAIAAKFASIQTMIMSSFKVGLISVAPFLVGIFADVADDFLGAKNSVFDNMAQGVSNAVVSVFGGLDNQIRQMTGNGLFDPAKGDGSANSIKGIGKALLGVFKILPSGLVEMLALTLMFEQVSVLGKMFLFPMLGNVTKALGGMAKAFQQAFMSGGSLKNIIKTLAADSAMASGAMAVLSFATKAALATAVIAFARSDFSDPLITSFHEAETSIIGSIQSIKRELDGLKPKAEEVGGALADSLPSKGLELNPAVLLGISENSYKSDDLIKSNNQSDSILAKAGYFLASRTGLGMLSDPLGVFTNNQKQSRKAKQQADELGVGDFFSGKERSLTLGQQQLLNQANDLKKASEFNYNLFSEAEIAPYQLERSGIPEYLKDSLISVKELDAQIGELGKQKFALTLEGTPEAKKKVAELREEIRKLFLQRQDKVKPIANIIEDIESAKSQIVKQREDIDNSNLPNAAKRALKAALDPQEEAIDRIIAKLKSEGLYKAVDGLGDSWAKVTDKLKDAELTSERMQRKNQLAKLASEKSIYQSYSTSKGAAAASGNTEVDFLRSEENRIVTQVKAQREALEKLLAIPQVEENPERAAEIEELRKNLIKSEDELAQTQTNLAKSLHQQAIAIKEFKYSLENFSLQSLQLDTQALQLKLDRQFKLDPKLNEEIFNLSQQLDTQLRTNVDSLRIQTRSLDDFFTSVTDYTYSLKDASFNLQKQSKEIQANIAKTQLSTNSAFFDAAGIQNQITEFFGKMSDLTSQALDLSRSDNRPQLDRDLDKSERDYQRNQKENQRRKEDINYAFNNTQADSNQAIARIEREIDLLKKREPIDKNELVTQSLSLEQQFRDYNRSVEESREVGRAYNIPVNLTQKQFEPVNTEDLENNYDAILSQIIGDKEKLIQAYRDRNTAEARAIKEGLARVTEAEKEAYAAQQQTRVDYQEQIKLEGERVAAETEKLAKTIAGTYLALNRSLKFGVPSIKLESDRLSLGNQDMYSSMFGTRDPQPYLTGRKKAEIEVGERQLQLGQQKSSLEDFIANAGKFTNSADLIKTISSLESFDPGLKAEILSKLNDNTTQEQIKEIIEAYRNQLGTVTSQLDELNQNKEAIAERAGKIAGQKDYLEGRGQRAEGRRQIGDALKESGKLNVFETAKMDRSLGEEQIDLDFEKQILGIENLKTATGGITDEWKDAYMALKDLRDIKLNNLIEQTDVLGNTLKDSVGAGFDSFISTLKSDFGDMDKLWRNTLASMLEVFANFAAQIAKQQLLEGLGNLLNKDSPSSGGSAAGGLGGLIATGIMAALHDGGMVQANPTIPNFAGGGLLKAEGRRQKAEGLIKLLPSALCPLPSKVNNFAKGGLLGAISDAYQRERAAGNQPVLLVAGVGERILNKEQTQEWNAWKSAGVKQNNYVPNMAMGGMVGNRINSAVRNVNNSSSNDYSSNDTININLPVSDRRDPLGRSEERQAALISERVRRAKSRNGN